MLEIHYKKFAYISNSFETKKEKLVANTIVPFECNENETKCIH